MLHDTLCAVYAGAKRLNEQKRDQIGSENRSKKGKIIDRANAHQSRAAIIPAKPADGRDPTEEVRDSDDDDGALSDFALPRLQ